MIFLFNFASRSRPDNFFRGVKSIMDNFSNENTFRIIAVLDTNDESVNNMDFYKRLDNCNGFVNPMYGKSTGKINAINRECENFGENWDILINMSDDMVFTKKDFDKDIVAAMPEDLDGYLHFRDSNHKQPDALCTLHIVGKKYFDRDKFIYHPDYISVWADNWNDTIAKLRKKYIFVSEVIFNHIHPCYRKAPMDEQYRRTEDKKVYLKDRITYKKMFKDIRKYV